MNKLTIINKARTIGTRNLFTVQLNKNNIGEFKKRGTKTFEIDLNTNAEVRVKRDSCISNSIQLENNSDQTIVVTSSKFRTLFNVCIVPYVLLMGMLGLTNFYQSIPFPDFLDQHLFRFTILLIILPIIIVAYIYRNRFYRIEKVIK